ncbi:Uu.00g131660.m01.CDS01 [Anthostomella pinea]|uniref:Uu.00g131660.m01.CDS01 n=1 Tax=Anthostomella pinea TaxID=933095 RepID=A0AAI8VJ03_9PEZI|nr:Uu.00g131660.m01.CDS01 [Anthostomella pinea]
MDPTMKFGKDAYASTELLNKVALSIVGTTALCWLVLAAFFWYQFFKPLKKVRVEIEEGIELRDLRRGPRSKPRVASWWLEH